MYENIPRDYFSELETFQKKSIHTFNAQ